MRLADLPDELLLCCVDGSLRICVKLASTSFDLRMRLVMVARTGFRLVCVNPHEALLWALYQPFWIGELILTTDVWPFEKEASLTELKDNCFKLHMILVNPEHADKVKVLYRKDWLEGLLVSMRDNGCFRIAARPIIKKVRPTQLQLTEMKWLKNK